MTRSEATTLKNEIDEAMAKIAKKHNLSLSFSGNCSFSDTDFAIRIKLAENSVSEKPTKRGCNTASSFVAEALGLPSDIIGKSFKHKTKTLTVTGLTPSRPKNAVCLIDQNGKEFKCSVNALKSFMS